jgi:hypothetical protein
MNLSELKSALEQVNSISILLPDGQKVPAHFHLTEAGLLTRHFIDCGGTERIERKINLQLWVANDFDHRLSPIKLKGILSLAEKKIGLGDLPVEVEYQQETVGKYLLSFDGKNFVLESTITDCLAKDKCAVEEQETISSEQCQPGGGCC